MVYLRPFVALIAVMLSTVTKVVAASSGSDFARLLEQPWLENTPIVLTYLEQCGSITTETNQSIKTAMECPTSYLIASNTATKNAANNDAATSSSHTDNIIADDCMHELLNSFVWALLPAFALLGLLDLIYKAIRRPIAEYFYRRRINKEWRESSIKRAKICQENWDAMLQFITDNYLSDPSPCQTVEELLIAARLPLPELDVRGCQRLQPLWLDYQLCREKKQNKHVEDCVDAEEKCNTVQASNKIAEDLLAEESIEPQQFTATEGIQSSATLPLEDDATVTEMVTAPSDASVAVMVEALLHFLDETKVESEEATILTEEEVIASEPPVYEATTALNSKYEDIDAMPVTDALMVQIEESELSSMSTVEEDKEDITLQPTNTKIHRNRRRKKQVTDQSIAVEVTDDESSIVSIADNATVQSQNCGVIETIAALDTPTLEKKKRRRGKRGRKNKKNKADDSEQEGSWADSVTPCDATTSVFSATETTVTEETSESMTESMTESCPVEAFGSAAANDTIPVEEPTMVTLTMRPKSLSSLQRAVDKLQLDSEATAEFRSDATNDLIVDEPCMPATPAWKCINATDLVTEPSFAYVRSAAGYIPDSFWDYSKEPWLDEDDDESA
ncbi:hypothetical protein MPSEU_000938100 [Mayamaea pseudoterrestris]|nr:hypothetical protein MPSEU_000938100 [Mayamaea pseudoterrestris]